MRIPAFTLNAAPGILLATVFAGVLALTSCNSSAPTQDAKKTLKVSEYLSGREAFQKLYAAAHAVAGDVKPYRMQSRFTKGAPANEGKSGLWRADFASPSKKLSKTFTWSGIAGADAPEPGVSFGADDTYNPGNTTSYIFDAQFLKVDSDAAFKVAQQHGGEKLTRANPDQPIFYTLDFDARQNQLVWRVVYGDSQNDAKLNVSVDATSGLFLREEK
jgi:hypothetical protein